MRKAIHVCEDAEELDWVGPWEVLASSAATRDDVEVVTVTDRSGSVRCAKGLRVLADRTWEDLATDIEPRPDDRFVDDGDVINAAGVSAGIDVARHLVSRLGSLQEARDVRRGIQYGPQPPV